MKFKNILTTAIAIGMMVVPMTAQAEQRQFAKNVLPKLDLDGNRYVDAVDASMALSDYADTSTGKESKFTMTQKILGDFNKDGVINAIDASGILSFYAESSVTSAKNLVQTSIAFSVKVKNDYKGDIDNASFTSYEECMEYIEQDKKTRKRPYEENVRTYIINVTETVYSKPAFEETSAVYSEDFVSMIFE